MRPVPEVSPADSIVGLYERNAEAWDRQRERELIELDWLERFAALLPEAGSVLDLGCGSGEPIARWLVERGFAVTGLDSSSALIALCRARFTDHEWIVADMRALDLGRRFDGILAWHSIFHLTADDQRAMFPRFAAHARPGGALMFTAGPEAGESIGEWQSEPLYHASLDPEEYEALLAANGFTVVERRLSDPECGHASVWLARRTG
jgi:SAM-dependent methyltransferase